MPFLKHHCALAYSSTVYTLYMCCIISDTPSMYSVHIIDKLYTQIINVFCLCLRIEPFAVTFWAIGIVLRVAAKIFVFVVSRKFREIIIFVFREIFLQSGEIFAKHETEICAKFSRNSMEISRNANGK